MPFPAAMTGSLQVCTIKPHVGGPLVGTAAMVLVGVMPAVVPGDAAVCILPPPNKFAMGSPMVLAMNKPMGRMNDLCIHGGKIVLGMPTILVGP